MARARLLWSFLFARGHTHVYGEHPSQRGDLYVPRGAGPFPVIVLIHGGSWRARYGKIVMRALAADLVKRGWAVWNIEYRRVGGEGGWPETFDDVAAAIDLLADLDSRLDLDHVTLLGHSAGGHLALWAAGRPKLLAGTPGAIDGEAAVSPRAVVALAGVCDLVGSFTEWNGGAVLGLMGGSPETAPERFENADPMAHVPLPIPVLLVHGVADEVVSIGISRSYARAAEAAHGDVELVEIAGPEGQHRAHIYPAGPHWEAVIAWLEAGRQPDANARASSTSSLTP
jgi:acetyl esterase/lipase